VNWIAIGGRVSSAARPAAPKQANADGRLISKAKMQRSALVDAYAHWDYVTREASCRAVAAPGMLFHDPRSAKPGILPHQI
jgi:hypothetical protein